MSRAWPHWCPCPPSPQSCPVLASSFSLLAFGSASMGSSLNLPPFAQNAFPRVKVPSVSFCTQQPFLASLGHLFSSSLEVVTPTFPQDFLDCTLCSHRRKAGLLFILPQFVVLDRPHFAARGPCRTIPRNPFTTLSCAQSPQPVHLGTPPCSCTLGLSSVALFNAPKNQILPYCSWSLVVAGEIHTDAVPLLSRDNPSSFVLPPP